MRRLSLFALLLAFVPACQFSPSTEELGGCEHFSCEEPSKVQRLEYRLQRMEENLRAAKGQLLCYRAESPLVYCPRYVVDIDLDEPEEDSSFE